MFWGFSFGAAPKYSTSQNVPWLGGRWMVEIRKNCTAEQPVEYKQNTSPTGTHQGQKSVLFLIARFSCDTILQLYKHTLIQ